MKGKNNMRIAPTSKKYLSSKEMDNVLKKQNKK